MRSPYELSRGEGVDSAAARSRGAAVRRAARTPRVLLMNFFAGVFERGIPLYAANLAVGLENAGVECVQAKCPRRLLRLPRRALDVLFVVWEQAIVPLRGLGCERVIYPYNSVSVLDSVLRNPAMVIHDFIQNSRRKRGLAARYVRCTQWVHARMGGDVVYVSPRTERVARRAGLFPRSRSFVFPNSFFRFQASLSEGSGNRGEHVLLCSGWAPTKDLAGALELYRGSGLWRDRELKIMGVAGHSEEVDTFRRRNREAGARIEVLPRLEDSAVADAYRSAAWVWVHSKKEGYGRPIAEAKMCGCRVVASDIAPFREQGDERTFFYTGVRKFEEAWARCESVPAEPAPREPCVPKEHALLAAELDRYLRANGFGHQNEAG